MNKDELVAHLRKLLEEDLDDVLQGDYDDRCEILSEFEGLVDRIEAHQC